MIHPFEKAPIQVFLNISTFLAHRELLEYIGKKAELSFIYTWHRGKEKRENQASQLGYCPAEGQVPQVSPASKLQTCCSSAGPLKLNSPVKDLATTALRALAHG